MRKIALPIVAVLGLTLLAPLQPASAAEVLDQPLADGTVRPIGPGTYLSASDSFRINETDTTAGLVGRTHSVVGQLEGVSQAQDAPNDRSDLSVFGPSWDAEFLGGQLNRKLTFGSSSITTTDLESNESVRYNLTDSLAGTNGGSVNTYTSADGSRLVENVTWNDLAGELKTTIVETLNVGLTTPVAGDDVPVDSLGNPIPAADLKPTYTYKQVGGSGDNWRVTAAGNTAYGKSSVSYDSAGRVSTVSDPATAGTPQSIKVNYATTTTASGETLGDIAGQVKSIILTSGETLASYSYDGSRLLRKVTDATEGTDLNTYTYDSEDRLATVTSPADQWHLTYVGDAAAPDAVQTAGTPTPDPSNPIALPAIEPDPTDESAPPITSRPTSPSHCNMAMRWIWWQYGDCVTTVAHYGWRDPSWRQLPNRRYVMGITYDHCTNAPDKPFGYDFRTACDGHDYAYGVIGNWYKNQPRRMTPTTANKLNADREFYDLLKNQSCPAYKTSFFCKAVAWTYYEAVSSRFGGNPKNGADATH
ncbi:phospholipase A2 [Streptomyces sp. NPDC101209]|uniref:phospholipase A2 n=1 Tax=Streptomyces sp. NPDC101209 TaxID=3366129 RepID=UPI00380CA36F